MKRRLCHYCRQPMKRHGRHHPRAATWDHRIPKSRGGDNSTENKVRACLACNGDKGNLTEEEYFEVLAHRRAMRRIYLTANA